MTTVKNYLSLVKFSHTIFAMPFALIGFVVALTQTNLFNHHTVVTSLISLSKNQLFIKFFLVITCMVTARSSAMAFNRYLDRSFDAKNPRTAIEKFPKELFRQIMHCVLLLLIVLYSLLLHFLSIQFVFIYHLLRCL